MKTMLDTLRPESISKYTACLNIKPIKYNGDFYDIGELLCTNINLIKLDNGNWFALYTFLFDRFFQTAIYSTEDFSDIFIDATLKDSGVQVFIEEKGKGTK